MWFALLLSRVPQIAVAVALHSVGRGARLVLLLGLLLLVTSPTPELPRRIVGLALLLAILNAACSSRARAHRSPVLALAGSLISWVVLMGWWSEAAAAVGLLSSLLVVVGLSLVMVGGYIWGLRYAAPARSDEPEVMGAPMVSHGCLAGAARTPFLFAVAVNFEWAVPPWPLFGALAVVTLAFSTAALAARMRRFTSPRWR